jgi:hypothetical protein
MNSAESWGTIVTPWSEKPLVLKDGSHYQLLRYQGKFNTRFPLQRYPFDSQDLRMEFEDSGSTAQTLEYVPDKDPVKLASGLALPGYTVKRPRLEVRRQPYSSTFGDTSVKAPEPYSRIVVSMPVTRPGFPYAVKLFLPLLIVLTCALLVFFINPTHVDGRFALGITALLTLVALKLTADDQLPNVEYLTMIDVLYIVGFLLAMLSLVQVVYSSRLLRLGRDVEDVIATDRRILKLAGAAFAVMTGMTFALYLG